MVVQAYILIQTDVGKAADVARAIAQVKGVTMAEDVTGPYDVIVRAEARNVDELLTAEPVTDRTVAAAGGAAALDDGGLPGFRGPRQDVRPLLAGVAAAVLVGAALGAVGARLRAPVRRMVRRRR